jgi:hypothetical protein
MGYFVTFAVFFLVLIGGVFAFLEVMPEAHFVALMRLRWGRELSLTVIFGTALGISLLTFNALQC